ncbi:DNA-directed RNA polymerase subunit N, partial [Candidatus Woesearchaeota archaeon CG1_02_47_18]
KYKERTAKGEEIKTVLDDLGLERYCCRAVFMGQIDLIDVAAQFKKF